MKRPILPFAEERAFGRAVGCALVIVAAYSVWRDRHTVAVVSGVVSVLLLLLSWGAPAALKWPSRAWWTLAHALGWVNTRLLLTIFFVLVIVPVGVVFRLIGRDLLNQRGKGSTWLPYTLLRDPDHYERMF